MIIKNKQLIKLINLILLFDRQDVIKFVLIKF